MNVQPTQNEQKQTKERMLPSNAMTLTVNEKSSAAETISISKNYSIEKNPAPGQEEIEIIINNIDFLESYKNGALFLTADGKRALGVEQYNQKRRNIG